jgi:uncharacterized iron-regulated membrane protein
MKLKKLAGKLHLWLGLSTGLVVFIIALTGALYCFAPELQLLTQRYQHVAELNKPFLPPAQIKKIAEEQLPGKTAARIYYSSKNRSVMVLLSKKETYSYSVFINPYSGQVLKVRNNDREFFSVVLKIHRTLIIPYGHEIIRWSTVIFLLMLISGIVLWWPKNKRTAKHGFVVKWNASPKRLNYDLHKVLGFYTSWFLLLSAFTGLIFAFESFAAFTYQLTGTSRSVIQKKPPQTIVAADSLQTNVPLDAIWYTFEKELHQQYATIMFVLPATKTDPVLVRANPAQKTLYKTDFRYFNQYTAQEITGAYVWGRYKDAATLADNIKRMNYDVHTGAILGLPGRLAMFFAALIAASLPLTGFYFWWGKQRKRKHLQKRLRK